MASNENSPDGPDRTWGPNSTRSTEPDSSFEEQSRAEQIDKMAAQLAAQAAAKKSNRRSDPEGPLDPLGLDKSSSYEDANADAIVHVDDTEELVPNEDHHDTTVSSIKSDLLRLEAAPRQLLQPQEFRGTICTAATLMVLNVVMLCMVFLLPVICNRKGKTPEQVCYLEPFSWMLYAHTIYWAFHLIGDQLLRREHKEHRLKGYIEFYIKTRNLRRTPFYIVSFGNAVLLVTAVALEDYCDNNSEDHSCDYKETKVETLRGLITIQCMTIMFMWGKYLMDVRTFNQKKYVPDLWRPDFVNRVIKLRPRDSSTRMENRDTLSPTPGPSQEPDIVVELEVYPPPREMTKDQIIEQQSELLVLLVPRIGQFIDNRPGAGRADST